MSRFSVLLLACLIASANAFSILPSVHTAGRVSETSLDLFGGLGDAFKNDDKLGARQNEGLKGVSIVSCCALVSGDFSMLPFSVLTYNVLVNVNRAPSTTRALRSMGRVSRLLWDNQSRLLPTQQE